MAHPSPVPSPDPPDWPHCGHGATAEDPVGCRGIHVPGHTACLAHLDEIDLAAYLATLFPGADIDHSGTPFTKELLNRLLHALRDHATGTPRLGTSQFISAVFEGDVWFISVTFEGAAWFDSATFQSAAWFDWSTFQDDGWFESTTFEGVARFNSAPFESDA